MENFSWNICIDRSDASQLNKVCMLRNNSDDQKLEDQKLLLSSASTRSRSSSNSSSFDDQLDRFKTELCHNFMENNGNCRYGTRCKFAHGKEEMRQIRRHPKFKTVRCKSYYESGSCPYGHRCNFIHDDQPALAVKPPAQSSVLLSYSESIRTILKSKGALDDSFSFSTSTKLSLSGVGFKQSPIARPTHEPRSFRIPDFDNNDEYYDMLSKIFLNTASCQKFPVPQTKPGRLSIFRRIVPSA